MGSLNFSPFKTLITSKILLGWLFFYLNSKANLYKFSYTEILKARTKLGVVVLFACLVFVVVWVLFGWFCGFVLFGFWFCFHLDDSWRSSLREMVVKQ